MIMDIERIKSAAKFRADFLLKHFFVPFVGARSGMGSLGTASIKAAVHVKKTIEALKTAKADKEHIYLYEQIFERLNCPYRPWRIDL